MRISATDLDAWRYYAESEQSFEEYLARVRGEDTTSKAAMIGRVFHKWLEVLHHEDITGGPLQDDFYRNAYSEFGPNEAVVFRHSSANIRLLKPNAVEVKTELQIEADVPGGIVTVVCKADACSGVTVVDYKTSGRPDFERFAEAYQWRVYLAAFPTAQIFRYDTFKLRNDKKQTHVWHVEDHMHMNLYRYNGLEDDVAGKVRDYVKHLQELASDGHIEIGARGVVKAWMK